MEVVKEMLFNRVAVKELGFPPNGTEQMDVESLYELGEKLRKHNVLRLGEVVATGPECESGLVVGDKVIYDVNFVKQLTLPSGTVTYGREDVFKCKYEKP